MTVVTNLLSADDAGFESTVGTWTAGSNTVVSRTTAQFHSGAASLRLTSSAAGAMAAFSGKYAVSPNVEYEAYTWAVNAAAASGRVVSIKIDWYTSGDVYISSSTGSSETLPNSTVWSGPAVVVGTSPATAAKASLQVNVTAGITAGSQGISFDDIAFGIPIQDAGNLLPYNTASIEMDTSGWSVSNGTLARFTGSAEGTYCLRATSTASGDMTITSAARFPVVAGTSYELYPWLFPPAVGRSVILELRWYTAAVGGSPISTSSRTATSVQTAIWERHTLLATAPATATYAEVRVRPQTTGAGEIWFMDRVTLRVQPLISGNLLSYSAQSFEIGVTDWTAVSNCTIARSAPQEMAYAGAYSMKLTATAAGQARVVLGTAVPVTAGVYYSAKVNFQTVSTSICWVDIEWYDASMVFLGYAQPDQDTPVPGSTWKNDTIGRQAPPGAAFAKMVALPQATSAGQVWYLDELSLVAGAPPYILEAHPETGSVRLTLQNLPGSGTVTLQRVDPDGTLSPVRGYGSDVVDYPVTGSTMVFEDYEVPLGVALRYDYGSTRTYSVTVDPPADSDYVWLTDPGEPGRNQLVMVEEPPSWTRDVARGVYPPRGAKMPVILSDVRQSRVGDLKVLTWTADQEAALDWLLDTGSVLLLRARPGWGLDRVYVSIGQVSEPRLVPLGYETGRRWTLPLTEVARPLGGMAGSASRTWATVKTDPDTPTWADVRTEYPTWLDVLQGVS